MIDWSAVLVIVYIMSGIVMAPVVGVRHYRDEPRTLRDSTSSAVIGVLGGLIWPATLVVLLLAVLIEWIDEKLT